MIALKSNRELDLMRKPNQIVAKILDEIGSHIKPGVSTFELDQFAEKRSKEFKGVPAFKGYRGFPASICISINEEVVHGIPSKNRILKDGDIVSIDFGVIFGGWYGDAAKTYPVGQVSKNALSLMTVTKESLSKAIEQCRIGNHLSDIGHAIQNYVEGFGYGVVREFVGHGIGRALHENPQVPNFGTKGCGVALEAGMVLAIEPMINAGGYEVEVLSDGWTAVSVDRSLSAHFEHTVAILEEGPEILSMPVGGLSDGSFL
jgi:methionyl aminopeptidase